MESVHKISKVKLVKLESNEMYQRLLNRDSDTLGIKCGHIILNPGQNVGEHTTGEYEEVIIVLQGNGETRINHKSILQIDCRAVLYIPPETKHDIKNTGDRVLEYIFITSLC